MIMLVMIVKIETTWDDDHEQKDDVIKTEVEQTQQTCFSLLGDQTLIS